MKTSDAQNIRFPDQFHEYLLEELKQLWEHIRHSYLERTRVERSYFIWATALPTGFGAVYKFAPLTPTRGDLVFLAFALYGLLVVIEGIISVFMIVALRKATSQYWIRLALIRDFYTKFEPPLASRSNDDSSILYPGDKHISYYKRFGYNFGIVWRIIAMNAFVALLSGGFGWFCSKENIVSWIILGLFVCVAFGQILVVPMQYRARLQNAEYDFRAQMNL